MRKIAIALVLLFGLNVAYAQFNRVQVISQQTGAVQVPVASGKIYVCANTALACGPGSATQSIYSNSGLTTGITQPVVADSNGNYSYWVTCGDYTEGWYDASGNFLGLVHAPDGPYAAYNSAGQFIGSCAPTASNGVPSTTGAPYYSELSSINTATPSFTAKNHTVQCAAGHTAQSNTQISTTATWATGVNTITVTSATGIVVGQYIYTASGIASGAYVTAVSGTTVTLNFNTSTTQSSAAAVVFTTPLAICAVTLPANYVTNTSTVRIWGVGCNLSAVTNNTVLMSIIASGATSTLASTLSNTVPVTATSIGLDLLEYVPGNASDTNTYIRQSQVITNSAVVTYSVNSYATTTYINWANAMTFTLNFVGQQGAGASAPNVSNCVMNVSVEQP